MLRLARGWSQSFELDSVTRVYSPQRDAEFSRRTGVPIETPSLRVEDTAFALDPHDRSSCCHGSGRGICRSRWPTASALSRSENFHESLSRSWRAGPDAITFRLEEQFLVNTFQHAALATLLAFIASATAGPAYAAPSAVMQAAPSAAVAPANGPHHLRIVTIGSTVDPLNGDVNPYGLAIAPVTAGAVTAGDLIVGNFNDSFNIQGLGTSIVALHSIPGSSPRHLIADQRLTGIAAIALGPTGNMWVASYTANDNPILSPNGNSVLSTLKQFAWQLPFGQAFSRTAGPFGKAAFYVSTAADGSIVRININPSKPFTFDVIATGFSVNHGVPGSILAPSGLSYDAAIDTLYIVDGSDNALFALKNVSLIPAGGVIVGPHGFSGPAAHSARLVFAGSPLNAPISSALLFNGSIVVSNTGDNRLISITPGGRISGIINLDKGPPGALFGLAATGTSEATAKVYFNDDNDNTVKVLEH